MGVCSVVGFPLGATTADVKHYEPRRAVFDGATEIDMVINIGALKSGELQVVERDIQAVVSPCRDANAIVKCLVAGVTQCRLNVDPAPSVDVSYVFYVCEEVDQKFNGLRQLLSQRPDLLDADAAILGEPTGGVVEAGCQGTLRVLATLHGVHLLGGTISIQSIVTTSVARLDPSSNLASNDSHTVLGAVTAAGQPATINERGPKP